MSDAEFASSSEPLAGEISRYDRILGCLLGGAVGDALGAPIEFLTLEQIRERHGPKGVTGYEEAYGRLGAITDDTQMTLFTAEGFLRAQNSYRKTGYCKPRVVMHRAYLRWVHTQGVPEEELMDPELGSPLDGWLVEREELHERRAPGNTCLTALAGWKAQGLGEPVKNGSKGCGGVMRIAPAGLFATDPFRFGCEAAALTHGHPTGLLASGAFAIILSEVLLGRPLPMAIDTALWMTRGAKESEETVAAIEAAVRMANEAAPARDCEPRAEVEAAGNSELTLALTPEAVARLGEGWVAEEALAIALYCALTAPDFRSGTLAAVNHGGDSDSTGAMTGSLLGTLLGVSAIPDEWIQELEAREIIGTVAEDLAAHFAGYSTGLLTPDYERYPPW
ncbi:MAG: ADP-ribosylglycohydrolase family protein [Gemmatimonadota bacterium]